MGFWELLHSVKDANFKIKERNHLSNNKCNVNACWNLIHRGVPDFVFLKSLHILAGSRLGGTDLKSVYDQSEF